MNHKQNTFIGARVFMLVTLCISLIIYFFMGSVGFGFHPGWVWTIAFFTLVSLFVYLISILPKFGTGKRTLTVTLTSIFLIYVVLTGGGMFFESNESVSFSSIHGIFDDTLGHDKVITSIYIETDGVFVIPLICYFNYPKKPPYAMHIYISERSYSLNKICIENACINYGDDERKYELNWDKKIPVPYSDADMGSIPAIIDIAKSCDIELSGYFTDRNGEIKRFRTHDRLELHYSRSEPGWRISTLLSGLHD